MSQLRLDLGSRSAHGLAAAITASIRGGGLAEGDRLPPIRTVATQLGLSPTTVSTAWAQLRNAGAIRTAGRRGTVVAVRASGPSRYRQALSNQGLYTLDLSTGTPDAGLLPDITAALHRINPPPEPESYLDEPMLPELAGLLHADWPYRAERITMVDGAMDAMQLITTVHLRIGDRVAVENPAFPPLLDLLEAIGVRVIPVDVDSDGLVPGDLAAAVRAGAAALFLQPRAHNPTGATLTGERVDQLARVLSDTRLVVVEDDSAGATTPADSISLGSRIPDRTIHIRSYSKLYGPDLRLAALGGPAHLVDPVVDRRFLGQGWTSRLLQRVLIDLLTHKDVVDVVARAQQEYARRRQWFVEGLAAHRIAVGGKDGLNIWVPVTDEKAAQLLLATRGIGVSLGDAFSIRDAAEPHIRVTVGRVAADREQVLDALVDATRVGRQPAIR